MDFSIILPSYNEAENLPSVIRGLKEELDKLAIRYEIIVANNNSSDNTKEALFRLKSEIPNLKEIMVLEKGYGNAIVKGLAVAQGEILGFIDADGQVEAKYLTEAYLELKRGNFGLCKGFRVKRYDGRTRLFVSRIYNLLFKVMFGGNFEDVNSKPKILTREVYKNITPLFSKEWFIDAEILIKTIRKKYKIGEIPIVFQAREKGVSKVKLSSILQCLKEMIYWRFIAKF